MSALPTRWCPDEQPHEPHEWLDKTTGSWLGRARSCPGVEELPEVACREEEPHETHQWRTDTDQPLLQCPGVEPETEQHELEFIMSGSSPHPVRIICTCGDQWTLAGPA